MVGGVHEIVDEYVQYCIVGQKQFHKLKVPCEN